IFYKDAKPNDAHYALAYLEKIGKLKKVITQNIDGLHQRAGSKNVIELHGSVYRNYCMDCKKSFALSYLLKNNTNIPTCDVCGGTVKPEDRQSTRLNSSHAHISYAVFCLKKKKRLQDKKDIRGVDNLD